MHIAERWSLAESSHNIQRISNKGAFGRYQITRICLEHYFDLTQRNINQVKCIKKYLLDDYMNCFISFYMYDFWRGQGYRPKEIMQIWLFGETGYINGRYSKRFENKIFPKRIVKN